MSAKTKLNDYDFASTDLLLYIWEKRVVLGIVTLSAIVLSVIVSFTITPMFKSRVVMFPTTNASVSKNLLAENFSGQIYELGEEDQAEQLIQVLYSEEVKDRIIQKHDLRTHYKIKPDAAYPQTQLNAIFRKNVNIKRTEYMSVQVDVIDSDPQMAADIANDIAAFTDTVFNNMLKKRATDAFHIVENEYFKTLNECEMLKDSLNKIRALGINNYLAQAERYHEAYGKALVSGNNQAIKVLDEKFKLLSKYGGNYDILNGQLSNHLGLLSRLNARYLEAKVEVDNNLSHKFLVDKAVKAEKKFYPKKSLIVIISAFSAFLMTLILLILSENLKKSIK